MGEGAGRGREQVAAWEAEIGTGDAIGVGERAAGEKRMREGNDGWDHTLVREREKRGG